MPSTNSIRTFFGRFVGGRSSQRSSTTGLFSEDFLRNLSGKNNEKSDCVDLSYSFQCSNFDLGSTIESGGVTTKELYLNNCRLKSVPNEVFRCSEVRVLNLCENELGELSPAVASLLLLEELYLDKNDLDVIPESLKCCKRLRVLHLNFLPIMQVPVCLPDLLNLTELCLNGCGIDSLPPSMGFLCQLTVLELRQNRLSFMPGALGRLSHLSRLDVGRNRIRSLPDTLPSLGGNLKELMCDWNELTELPEGFEEMEALEFLDLTGNFFRKFPDTFKGLKNLELFCAADNELTSLPNSLTMCLNLEVLNVDNNRILELPQSVGRLKNLHDLSVRGNKLGTLPQSIGSLKCLKMLLLDTNFISSIPPEIAGLDALSIVSLRDNRIADLCGEIGALDELKVLDLRGNRLKNLPRAIRRISEKMAALWLADNQTTPKLPLIEETEPIGGKMVLTCVLLPQPLSCLTIDTQQSPAGAEKQEWSISPARLYQWDKQHRGKIRREMEEIRQLNPGKKSRKLQNEVHVLPSSPRWGSIVQNKKPEGPPPPIRPYAMVDLKTLQAQLLAEKQQKEGASSASSANIPWYLQADQQTEQHNMGNNVVYGNDKRASAPVGHYEAIFDGLGKGLKPNNGNLVVKQRTESHYEKLYDKNEVPDRMTTGLKQSGHAELEINSEQVLPTGFKPVESRTSVSNSESVQRDNAKLTDRQVRVGKKSLSCYREIQF